MLDRLEAARHRDGGRDADARAASRRTSTIRRGATSRSTSRASPPASGRADPEVARALGTRIDLFADAALPPGGAGRRCASSRSAATACRSSAPAQFENLVYTGRNAIRVADLAIFSGLADRDARAARSTSAPTAASRPLSGGFDLTFDGSATDLALGDPRLDRLLAGETTLVGPRGARRDRASAPRTCASRTRRFSFASNGQISSTSTDIGFDAALSDLALLDPRARRRR